MTAVRRLLLVLGAALAFPAGAVAAGTGMAPLTTARLLQPARPFHDSILRHAPARTLQGQGDPEGTYPTSDGMTVHVVFSGLSAPDAVAGQSTADFLDALLHGPELSTITVDLAPFATIEDTCGFQALACYFPIRETLFVPTALPASVGDIPLEQILAHEYGHHVAASRSNPPWSAVDWGPKRWASYMNVCAHTFSGEMFPGDEGAAYELNPGEGWAEAFRFANSQRIGTWRDIGWPIVDDVFRPDATAVGLVAQDVLAPWAQPAARQVSGRLRKGKAQRVRISTPLDGGATARATGPAGIRVAFENGRRKRQSADGRTATVTVCGARTTTVTLSARKAGRFVLRYSVP
jgi:hypothetical protein